MNRILWHQTEVLAERYLEVMASDAGNTFLLLAQAPFIAVCIVLVWRDVASPTDALYFVMALTAVWFGAINACREIVKERPIFHRERLVGEDPTAYLLSKLIVLAMLGFVQCLCLVFMVNHEITLGGPPLLLFAFLYAASLAGTALGLCLSAIVATSERAVACVPLLLLPQILFSNVILSHEHASDLIKWIEDLTIVAWAYDGLKEAIRAQPSGWHMLGDGVVLVLMGMAFGLLPWILLKHKRG
jgi:hypothetical protein